MKVPKRQISITLDAPLLKEVRLLAQEENRTRSGYINTLLKAHVENRRKETE